jgi:hypothetical protein
MVRDREGGREGRKEEWRRRRDEVRDEGRERRDEGSE